MGMARAIAGVLCVVLLLCSHLPPATGDEEGPRAKGGRPLVGAIRWDAWTHWAGENEWGGYEACLGPRQWHDRLPFYARVVSDEKVEIRADTQEIMDQEIAYASEGGVDYWAFGWYHPQGWPNAENMTRSFDLYLSSARASDVSYCLILFGGPHLGPKEDWPATVDYLVERFSDANYQKVLGDRPLVYLFVLGEFAPHFGDEAEAKKALSLLRERSLAAGLGDPYMAAMCFWPPGGAGSFRYFWRPGEVQSSVFRISGHVGWRPEACELAGSVVGSAGPSWPSGEEVSA